MSLRRLLPGAALASALLLSACAQTHIATQPLPPQTIGPRGVVTAINFGKVGAEPFTILVTVRPQAQDGNLAVCGAAQVLAKTDLTPNIVDGFGNDKSSLTLTLEGQQAGVVLSPKFLPVTFKKSTDGKFRPADIGEQKANCVLTPEPWSPQWSELKFHGKLELYGRTDVRQRSQTVVGAPGGAK